MSPQRRAQVKMAGDDDARGYRRAQPSVAVVPHQIEKGEYAAAARGRREAASD
jgi:hypothetical protein